MSISGTHQGQSYIESLGYTPLLTLEQTPVSTYHSSLNIPVNHQQTRALYSPVVYIKSRYSTEIIDQLGRAYTAVRYYY